MNMLRKLSDASDIQVGDPFRVFRGEAFVEGCVDEVSRLEVIVDFDDCLVSFPRDHVNYYEEIRGTIEEFYSTRDRGQIVKTFN